MQNTHCKTIETVFPRDNWAPTARLSRQGVCCKRARRNAKGASSTVKRYQRFSTNAFKFREINFQNVVQDNWRSRSHDQHQKQADMELLRHLRSKIVQMRQNVNWRGQGYKFVWSILLLVHFSFGQVWSLYLEHFTCSSLHCVDFSSLCCLFLSLPCPPLSWRRTARMIRSVEHVVFICHFVFPWSPSRCCPRPVAALWAPHFDHLHSLAMDRFKC